MTLKDLAVEHPYYSTMQNYYSNEAFTSYPDWKSFSDEMMDADIDYDLCYRWDIKPKYEENPDKGYSMELSIMHQRKGRYWPQVIETVTEEDVPGILEYLNKHAQNMLKLWKPLL